MVYAFIQDVPIGEDLYRRIVDKIGPEPMTGGLLHLCVRQPDGKLRYIDVWDSEESCTRAFEERIHPAVDAAFAGNRPSSEPEVHHLDVLHATGALLEETWS
jgi:hypothetical protein